MELKIAELTGEAEGYYILYPSPAPPSGPRWLAMSWDGEAVCDSEYVPSSVLPYVLERLRKAADAAVARGDGQPLDERRNILGYSSRAWAQELGWLGSCGVVRDQVILPDTPVFFPDGLPEGLRKQARGNLKSALRLLAESVCYWEAAPAAEYESLPEWGETVTAAELAAV
jgi:hypothetical protein